MRLFEIENIQEVYDLIDLIERHGDERLFDELYERLCEYRDEYKDNY